jgi:hypothetical protein
MACPPNSMDEACPDVADVVVIEAPACPRCAEPMTWSWYNRGSYGRGWHCEHFATCGFSSANCGAHRWHCSTCRTDICDACHSDAGFEMMSVADEEMQVRSILAPGAGALRRMRPESSGLGEDAQHGQVWSILAQGAGALLRPRREPSGRGEGEEHGQVQSILAPPVPVPALPPDVTRL